VCRVTEESDSVVDPAGKGKMHAKGPFDEVAFRGETKALFDSEGVSKIRGRGERKRGAPSSKSRSTRRSGQA
jgi:hypothetical protein